MTTVSGDNVKVTIDGAEVPVESFSYEHRLSAEAKATAAFTALSHTFSATLELLGPALDGLKSLPGTLLGSGSDASDATLTRRLLFNNRKGRSALRRLRARGLRPVWITTDDGFRTIALVPISASEPPAT